MKCDEVAGNLPMKTPMVIIFFFAVNNQTSMLPSHLGAECILTGTLCTQWQPQV